jgi:hypothetical protein
MTKLDRSNEREVNPSAGSAMAWCGMNSIRLRDMIRAERIVLEAIFVE